MLHLVLKEFGSCAELLGIAFANTAIASCLLVALACCAMRLRGWNASSRYCAWWLVLALVLLLPAIQLVSRPADGPSSAAVIPSAESGWRVVGHFEGMGPAVAALPHRNVSVAALPKRNARGWGSAATVLPLVCCCGLLLQLARLSWALFASLRMKKSAAAATDAQLLAAFSRAAERAHMRRSISVAISPVVKSPVLVGYRRPAILLPGALVQRLQPEELEQVFSHELAHAARYDDWAVAFQRILQAGLFFHPLVHFVCWRIDVHREISCDDRVIASVQPARYAACLTRIAELSGFAPQVAGTLPLLSRKSNLVSRVETMLDRTRSHVTLFSPRRLLCFACGAAAVGVIGLRGPALFAYPANAQPRIALPSLMSVAVPRADAVQAPDAQSTPKERKSTVSPVTKEAARKLADEKQANGNVSSIEVTSRDGSTSSFDSQGGADRHTNSALPPGTIVFRRDGQSYIIRDPATIAGAEELIRPIEQLGHAQIDVARHQEQMAKAEQKLKEEIDATVQRSLNPETMKKLTEMQGQLQEKLRSIQTKDWQKEGKELDELARKMSSEFANQQGEFGELQEKLNREMSELQQRFGALGGTQENQELQKKLKNLIESAEKNGLATPLN